MSEEYVPGPETELPDPSDPLTLRCGLTLPNRIALAPLTNTQSHPDGTLDQPEYDWLLRRARGGFGLIETCAAFVSEEGHAWKGQLGIASDHHLPGLTRLATGLRDAGAHALVQLHHGGVHAKLAPERISTGGPAKARAATLEDLDRIVGDFVSAAVRAERAGFAGVEIHGANGYLITQFLAPDDNPRTDDYGGSLANRARLARRIAQGVRQATSPGFCVGMRISPVDTWSRRGLVLDDGLQLGQWLAEDGLDFVHLSLRDASGTAPFVDDPRIIATAFQQALPDDIAILSAGGIWTRDDAQRALDAGVDVAVLGRSAIGNPDWPKRYTDPDWEPVRTPFTPEHLRSVDVGEAFVEYLKQMSGMVVGGRQPHD